MLPSGGTGGYQQDDAAKSTTEQTRSSYHHDLSTQYHQQQRLLNDEPIPTFMTAAAQDDGSSMHHHHHQYLIDTATQQQQQQQQPFYHYYLGDNDDDGTITGSSVPMFLQGRHDQEHYDPTLTPLPGPSRTSTSLSVSDQQHIWQQQVAAIEQAAAIEQQQQQQQQAAIAAQAAAAVALDDFEYVKEQQQQQCQEQALFGRLVSMARAPGSSNSSCIATQQDDTWSSPNLHSLHYGSAWATTPATTPTAMMEEQNEPLHSIQETIMSSDQLQNAQFELKVVQQPSRARMCGFGDKDRRPISPPPIVQLIVRASDGTQIPARDIDTSFLVVFCDCWQQDMAKPANMVYSASSSSASSAATASHASSSIAMRNLVGACVATGAKLYNVDGEFGIFYVFHDLSLRSEGKFRLLFSLLNIGTSLIHSSNTTTTTSNTTNTAATKSAASSSLSSSPKQHTVNTRSISSVVTTTFSDVFIAYTAKTFPGVVSPTALSQCFAKQGVKIPIRSDTKPRGTSRKRNSSTTTTTSTITTNITDPFHSQDSQTPN